MLCTRWSRRWGAMTDFRCQGEHQHFSACLYLFCVGVFLTPKNSVYPFVVKMSNNTLLGDALADTETNFWDVMIPVEYLGKTRVMIGMVVSGFCVLSFLVFLFWRCINKVYQDDDTQKLSRKLLPSSIFIMIM